MAFTIKIKDEDGTITEVELTSKVLLVYSDARLGDDGTVFFMRQLEAVEAQSYDILYPDLEARLVFPTNSFGGAGAQTLTYRSFDKVGAAKVINARAIDLPKSDIKGFETSITVKAIGCAYDFDIDEVEAATMTGLPLEARRAMASRRGYEQLLNSIVWYGDAENNLPGFFSNASITQSSVATSSVGTGTSWKVKTPDEILKDMNTAVSTMVSSTLKIHRPERMYLPVDKYNYIAATARSPNSDTTILEYFLKNNKYVKQVESLNAIAGRGLAGAECMILMCMTSPEGLQTVRIREPLPLQYLPVQIHGLVYEIPGRGRFAGLEVTYPAAFAIWSGI